MDTEWVVMDACAKMPLSCKGQYRRVALVLVEVGAKPKMISERAKGVIRIERIWERLSVGKTDRCAYRQALATAMALAVYLNESRVEE